MPAFELIAATHSPFAPNGDLALDVVAKQATHLRANGLDGVLIAGSTGEGSSLTSDERRSLAERWTEVGEGLQVWVHVGHNSPREAQSLAAHAASVGAHGICAAPPSWFPLSSVDRLVDTCAEIAAGAPKLPFLYYHIPVLSHVQVPMARFAEVARRTISNFRGIKYTHLDALDFQVCVREHGDAIKLYWGCDELLVTGLALGAHGAVGSTYNFAAPLYRRLIAAHAKGDTDATRELQGKAAELVELLAGHGYMAAAKTTMRYLGVDVGTVRCPMPLLQKGGEEKVIADLERFGLKDLLA
jgi:N-acetylneuraminate lyase